MHLRQAMVGSVPVDGAGLTDVVLMDIRMPGVDGLEAARLITARPDPCRAGLTSAHAGSVRFNAKRGLTVTP